MQHVIRNRPSFANLHLHLQKGDRVIAEADAMRTRLSGGLLRGLLRRSFGGESMFVNEFSTESTGELVLTQPFPGDIECLELNGTSLFLQPGAFIACEPGVRLGLAWAGVRMAIAREGLFRLRVSGNGKVWFGAYGGIFSREVTDEYVVDSGHLVAYEPTIGLRLGMAGGLLSSFFSQEGLVTRVRGPGRVYLQSRSFGGLAAWANAHLW